MEDIWKITDLQMLKTQVENKGREITEYREKYNIKIRGMDDKPVESGKDGDDSSNKSQSVLVDGK